MTRSRLQNPRLARATAWLLLLLCGWMATGGVLHHTDAGMSARAASSVQHRTAALPADTCAACQWTQAMQTGTFTVCQVASPLSVLHPRLIPVVRRVTPRLARRRSPRAPPLLTA